MNDPMQLIIVAKQLREMVYGKPRRRAGCWFGVHPPAWIPVLDHDKRLRKVFGVSHVKLCRHCAKVL